MTPPRLHLTGASCTGTTTLGAALAARLDLPHLDSDDFYWAPVEPPFSQKRPPEERLSLMKCAQGDGGWVLSGSLMGWGEAALDGCDLIVFLSLPWKARRARLVAREQARFGDRIAPGGDMYQIHQDFLAWAEGYDDPQFDGRSRARHEAWLQVQGIPVLTLDSAAPVAALMAEVLNTL